MKKTNIDNLTIIKNYLKWVPISLCIREVTRIVALSRIEELEKNLNSKTKILDVGCGDGKLWQIMGLSKNFDITGIDISKNEIDLAKNLINANCIDITSENLKNKIGDNYNIAIGNCSLEHIKDIHKAFTNINELLAPDGIFILILPTPDWVLKTNLMKAMENISPRLAMSFSGLINGFFQHWHLYHYSVWKELLINCGFRLKKAYGLGTKRSMNIFWLFLPLSFFSFIIKIISNRYLIFYLKFLIPDFIFNFFARIIDNSLEKEMVSADDEKIFEYLIICDKINEIKPL